MLFVESVHKETLMDPLSALVLVGLLSLGFLTVAALFAGLLYVLLWALVVLAVVVIIVAGIVSDYLYERRRKRENLPYRLAWYYRWKGWQIGRLTPDMTGFGWKDGMIYDRKERRLVPMIRRVYDYERT